LKNSTIVKALALMPLTATMLTQSCFTKALPLLRLAAARVCLESFLEQGMNAVQMIEGSLKIV
jgi:hypothetical protein